MTADELRNVGSIQRRIRESRYKEMIEVADKTQAESSVMDDR
jgi:hypothetical protein